VELTREADYGVRLMIEVAAAEPGTQVTVSAAARRQLVPGAFLAKIARRLVLAGLLRAGRGSGGLTLGRPAAEVDLLQIVEALEGPLRLNRCLAGPGACALDRLCPAHPVWCDVQAEVERRLRAARLSDLAADLARRRRAARMRPSGSEGGEGA
jgi:Rrf2 family protein